MQRRKFLYGVGASVIGGSSLLGSGAFSRVESQRDVTIEVAEDPDAYLGLDETGSTNSDNYVELDDDGHIEIDIGENPNGGEGVNSDSFTWFDSMVEVCNQGKEDVGFWIVPPEDEDFPGDIDATGLDGTLYEDEPRLEFYIGKAAGTGDDGTTSVMGEDNAVLIPLGECIELGVRMMTKGIDATENDQLFGDEIQLIADVAVDGDIPVEGGVTRFDLPEYGQEQFDLLTSTDLAAGDPTTGERESKFRIELEAEDDGGEPLDDEDVTFGVTVTDHLGTDPFFEAPNDSLSGTTTVAFDDGEGSFTIGGADSEDADLTLGFFGFLPEINDVETIQIDVPDEVEIVGRALELAVNPGSTAVSGEFTDTEEER